MYLFWSAGVSFWSLKACRMMKQPMVDAGGKGRRHGTVRYYFRKTLSFTILKLYICLVVDRFYLLRSTRVAKVQVTRSKLAAATRATRSVT